MITVELYEVARRLAGVAEVELQATTLREALIALAARHPALEPDVVRDGALAPHWRAGLGGRTWIEDADHPLEPGDRVVLVSAIVGG